ncbi:cohesin domain-containing protein [Granulicella paludicola]|uniref:cohesin domain-containing protein n=1 Tax=Granulicella paludicola TaxID=474951 RepID=UPI0021DFB952|nr:cohesin domain-containing protein [Granulicella paludicola]
MYLARLSISFSALFVVLLFAADGRAQTAAKWDKRGQDAESRADYDAAFEAFRQAHTLKPKDLRYQTHYERMRFQDSNTHLDRGRVLRQSGDLGGALTEFSRALKIDNSNQSAAQELLATQMPSSVGASSEVARKALQTPHQRRVRRDVDSLEAPVELKPMSNDPITLHMVEDSKTVYQAIGKAAGLNVLFDADYSSKRMPVDLTKVSLFDALRIVGKLSGTFWSPVTENTIFVAQNSRAKHTDLDDLAIETFYLTNVTQQNDANEVLVALRNLFDPSTKLYLVASQNAIVVRATPAELILAEKLIDDLDRTRSEVVVDVAVLEVSRDLERNLGITLPTSFGLTPQASNANVSSSSTTTTTSTTTSGITLNTLANMNATNFAVTVGGGTVNALLSDSDTRVLQNPRVRATDGQQATLKIGSKIPVATGSTTSTLTSTATSTTQFTYVDVGVNIDMTPTVHADGQVSLKMKIEISSQTGTSTIDDVAEPIISQRVVQQVIQLKDGEPSILAGLLTQQDTKSVSGTPGLGELPFLKYFFSSQDKVQQTDEIVFLLIPHIVRESIIEDANTRIVDTGTSQQIELRRGDPNRKSVDDDAVEEKVRSVPAVQTTSAANAASAMLAQLASQARAETPMRKEAAGPLRLGVVASAAEQRVGSTFAVAVNAANARDLYGVPLQIQFDPKVLSLVDVGAGDLLSRDGQAAALVQRDEGQGLVTVSVTRPPHANGVSGDGAICVLTFKAVAAGSSPVTLVKALPVDSKQTSVEAVEGAAVVRVQP